MQEKSELFMRLREELRLMCQKDQQMRTKAQTNPDDWDENIDRENTAKLKEIIDEIGWPSISQVGEEGASNAWLLVQHADHDLEFQKRCLALMKVQPVHEVSARDIAYLEDRIAVGEGRPQVYGTQFQRRDGRMVPLPIVDPENVDTRRQEVGLDSLAEYQKRLQRIWT